MNRILLIVEGEDREKIFFDRYKEVKKIKDDLDVVPFRQNIKELYRISREYIFDGIKPDNIIDILKDAPSISTDDKKVLDGKFTDAYLIFDLDLQNARNINRIDEYLRELKDLVNFFNDSTSIGQILINYPSMDSIFHLYDGNHTRYIGVAVPSDFEFLKKYKNYISINKMSFDCNKLSQDNFEMMAAINLKKASFIVTGEYKRPSADTYIYNLNQANILDKQINFISSSSVIYVLNTSLFIDVDLFGRTLFFHPRGERLFEDDVLINNIKKL